MESRCEIRHEMVLPPATYENDVKLRYNVRLSLDFRTVPKMSYARNIYEYIEQTISMIRHLTDVW